MSDADSDAQVGRQTQPDTYGPCPGPRNGVRQDAWCGSLPARETRSDRWAGDRRSEKLRSGAGGRGAM